MGHSLISNAHTPHAHTLSLSLSLSHTHTHTTPTPTPTHTHTQDGLNAVLRLLDWSWNRLYKLTPDTPTSDGDYLTFIAKSALGLLKTYIQQSFPEKGRPSKPDLDCSELAAAVFEARTLLHLILSSRRPHIPSSEGCVSPLETVIDACYEAFRTCFHAFYPTTPLKWFALCQQLQIVDPVCHRFLIFICVSIH